MIRSNMKSKTDLIVFKEDNVFIIHSPLLDISGYGYTKDEAKESFNITLEEFLRYQNTQIK